jgi:predicted dehydrogenase
MSRKIRWGVLGVARIATTKVIPAMQQGHYSEVHAIASRDGGKAQAAAESLHIQKAYSSYEELLADSSIDAIYNPLPNHLHVPWSIRAAEAGKHVLCEKPIGLSVAECRELMDVEQRTRVKIGEAFMVRTHPQWIRARELKRAGELGEIRSIIGTFTYFNRDPQNVRNVAAWGGGALMDIGCYPIQISRFLLDEEPLRVIGLIERDPEWGVDRLTSGMLEFPSAHSVFTVGTQLVKSQNVQILGSRARLEIEIPYNPLPGVPSRIFIDRTGDPSGDGIETEQFDGCDQYTIQGDLFSKAILDNGPVPTPLTDSLCNMAVIEALFESAHTNQWTTPKT